MKATGPVSAGLALLFLLIAGCGTLGKYHASGTYEVTGTGDSTDSELPEKPTEKE